MTLANLFLVNIADVLLFFFGPGVLKQVNLKGSFMIVAKVGDYNCLLTL